MRWKRVVNHCAAAGSLALLTIVVAHASPADDALSGRFALQVGIDDYKAAGLPGLHGCVQDVIDLRALLVQRFGFSHSNILTLTNGRATHQAILAAFRAQLITNAQRHPDALVIFEYSGHGSRVPDTNNDEPDGFDETIVPADSRNGGAFDINDDELYLLFSELSRYTSNIVFILDCCHSGTGTRGDGAGIRQAPMDRRPQPPQPDLAAVGGAPPIKAHRGSMLPKDQGYVTIAACQPGELSSETDEATENPGKHNGALTFHLIQALRRARHETTYRELMAEIMAAVSENYGQHPMVEGDIRRPVLAGSAGREDPFIPVELAGDQIVLKAGAAQGIGPGAMVGIYSPEARQLVGDRERITNVIVKSVGQLDAMAAVPPGVKIPAGSKGVPIAPGFGDSRLRVVVSTPHAGSRGVDEAAAKILERHVAASPLLAIAPAGTRGSADVDVMRARFEEAFRGSEYGAQSADGRPALPDANALVWYVKGPDGRPMADFWEAGNDSAAVDRVRKQLENLARQRKLRALQNVVSPLIRRVSMHLLEVHGHLVSADTFLEDRADTLPMDRTTYEVTVGDTIRIVLENESTHPLFMTLLDLGSDGSVELIYPREGDDRPLLPGQAVSSETYTVTPPAGIETYKLIVTTQYRDFGFLRQESVLSPVASRGGEARDPLSQLLMQANSGVRGGEPAKATLEDWATEQVDLMLSPRRK